MCFRQYCTLGFYVLTNMTKVIKMKCLFFKQGSSSSHSLSLERNHPLGVLHVVEGLALVVLCSCRPATRRLAVNVLKEVRVLHTALGIGKVITLDSESSLLLFFKPGTCFLMVVLPLLFRGMKNWPLMLWTD